MNPFKAWLDDARRAPDVRHVDTCDGIRAMAILIVGWFHIWQQSWLYPSLTVFGREISLDPLVRSGYMWVDIMILISGFCLFLPWVRAREEGRPLPATGDFYARRLMRIEPSYLLALAIMAAVAIVRGAYRSRADMAQDLLAHLTYTHTFFYKTYYATPLGGALWTLAIEMQLYLLFPLLARAFLRLPATTLAAMVGVSLAFRGWVAANVEDVSLYFNQLPAYLDTFALGMAAAVAHVRLSGKRHGALQRLLCSALSVLMLMLLWRVARRQASCPGTEAIRLGQMANRLSMGLLGAGLLLCSAHAGLLLRKVFSNPLTRFVSSVSMQFYIWHQTLAVWLLESGLIPSQSATPNYDGEHVWQLAFTAACFIGAFAVAALLTYGFERPAAKALGRRRDALRGRAEKEKGA